MSLKPLPSDNAPQRLAKAVLAEAIDKGYGDLFDESWNPQAHVNITLTIAEVRDAVDCLKWHTRASTLPAQAKRRAWREFVKDETL